MNPNPNANPRHHYHHNHHHTHHGSSGTSNVQGYPGNSLPNQLDDRGSCSGGLNIPNHPHSPMPPSSWVKNSPQTTPTNLPLTSINSSNAANSSCCSSPNVNNLLAAPGGMPGSSYGASNSNSFQQQHPHQFYTETPDVRYTPGTGNNKLNSTSNRPNQNLNMVNTGMQFYSNENHTDSSCYFQQQQQQQHPTNFDCDHQNSMGKNNPVVCDNNGSSGDLQNPNNTNFYGFYSSHNTYHNSNHSHQQQQQQPSQEFHHSNLNSGSNVPNPNEGDYSRFHGFNMSGSANSAHSSHQQQQLPNQIQNTPLSCQQQSQGYFGMIGNRHAVHPQSQSPYALCQQNPHQNAPFRRNSIESFSTEPGDLPYNVKYGCNFNTMGNIPFGDVIKRETGTMHVSTWQTPREPSLNSLSHQHGNGNSQGYFFNNNSSTNNNLNPRASEHNFQNQHQPQQQPQQQQFQNFKSCSFDMGHHSSMEIDQLKPDLQAMKSNNMTVTGTPSAVKHRSLSCSMMNSPFQFSSNSSSNDDGHFNFLDNIGNHPSCSNISNSPTSGSNSMSTSRNVNVPVDSLPVSQKPPPMESSQQNDCNQTEPGGVFVGSRTCPTSASNVDCGLNPVQDTKPLQNIKSVQESASSEPQEKSQTCESTGEIPTHVIKQEDIIQQTSSSGDTNDDPGATSDFQNELGSNMDEVSEKDIDSLIISTTTAGDRTSMDTSHTDEIDAKSSPSAPRIDDGCHNLILEALDDADVSNSSCSLGLLVNTGNEDNSNTSLSHLAITGANDSDDNDNESCHSGMSSLGCASKALSDICSSDVDRNRLQNVVGMTKISHSPQKISKRSFSEADKDLVINTTAVSFRNTILIPAGWKREIVSSTGVKIDNNLVVFYVR
ncbi:unnamed protein product [Allacma fusca]|uniref:Uncharacterized protein n=1 Tax=Allacma fusca TaxID=39272 RepID=A0A8J2JC37_9HEXA|nr:unnamed protein product [Allacma fusca]